MTTRLQVRRHQRERANVSRFAALIAEPATAEFDMPANGRIRFVATAGAAEEDTAATLTGAYINPDTRTPQDRVIQTPELEEGGYVTIDSIERAVHVELEAGYEAWVDTGLGKYKKIAENP